MLKLMKGGLSRDFLALEAQFPLLILVFNLRCAETEQISTDVLRLCLRTRQMWLISL